MSRYWQSPADLQFLRHDSYAKLGGSLITQVFVSGGGTYQAMFWYDVVLFFHVERDWRFARAGMKHKMFSMATTCIQEINRM